MKPLPQFAGKLGLPCAVFTLALLAFGCNSNEAQLRKMLADSVGNSEVAASESSPPPPPTAQNMLQSMPSFAARLNRLDSTHQFVREGNLQFRVKDVPKTTYRIEQLTENLGGYVNTTQLNSRLSSQTRVRISEDSLLETTQFTVTNTMRIRIPAVHLDSFLRALVPLADYLDYRNLSCTDVTIDLLAEQLAQKRNQKYAGNVQQIVDSAPASKISEKTDAQGNILSSATNADEALLAELRQKDKVEFSTLEISIYQPEFTQTAFLPYIAPRQNWEPSAGTKFMNSLAWGWKGLLQFLYVVVLLWPLWLVGIAALLVYRRFKAKKISSAG
ncbi:MAG: DUF4349 domain-containing protein [Bacteroidia bacterium]